MEELTIDLADNKEENDRNMDGRLSETATAGKEMYATEAL
ncbi:hypothetical protein CCACVL1_25183 [Corchorus capsularis]|uniref:Uncharacterized protein n=1 Tax=Corchorus capsularis TaxID=210143 RepID=A0A1R3GLQ6_COCAP|nr:hypothetical protein CCACVL1_25183 [Corchorus capsularis]